MRVALVTCRELPEGDEDADLLAAACAARDVRTTWEIWDDPAVDWAGYDLAVIRSTWDYARRRDEFLAWAETVSRLANPASAVRGNTDKTYLRDLAAAGVPVVPTSWLVPGEADPDAFGFPDGDVVIKPSVGCGSIDVGRYRPDQLPAARDHLRRLVSGGRTAMVQPYLDAVDTAGETALFFVHGRYSHAVGKAAMLGAGDQPQTDGLYKEETVTAREPSAAERDLAAAALAALPGDLLYARVDVLPGPGGDPVVLEVELTEPSFFLAYADAAAQRFADGIVREARR